MILKNYELNKIKSIESKIFLFYGKNEGLKKEIIKNLSVKDEETFVYEEKEILENSDIFFEKILTQSLFENKRLLIIKRATEKILKIIEVIKDKNIENTRIIINTDILEKRSRLRSFFEKDKKFVCVAFYPDDYRTILQLANKYLKERNISISQLNINRIIEKCNFDRNVLFIELEKIENLSRTKKKIDDEEISKLINIVENYSVSELIDNCLINNKKKIIYILNENNFSNEDAILILRTFLNKAKKILKLAIEYEKNNNIDLTLSNAKPPIFWKDKEITKQQIQKWKSHSIKKLIFKINEIELNVKKNINNSVYLVSDFLLKQS